ncbi:MAG TPA: right-handed parallel beta-helix repeat-containing protein [Chthoniobacterales bacterium]
MSKRIRCSCGRVYDPGKHAACPVCGTINVVIAEPPPLPNEPEKPAVERIAAPPPLPSPTKTSPGISLNPRHLAIGVAVILLVVIVVALSRCGGKGKAAAVVTPTPSATTTVIATPTPAPLIATPAPTVALTTPTPAPVTPPPNRPPVPPPSGLTNNLAAQIAQAAPGATINLPAGVYPGGLVIARALHLVGVNDQVFIQGQGQECLAVQVPGVTLQNIRFTRNGGGRAPAITVAEGADLQMQNCQVHADAAIAVGIAGNGAIKASACTFAARGSTAISLTKSAQGDFRQTHFDNSRIGLWLAEGARAELHSCAFAHNEGAIMVLNNAETTVQADDCQFLNNPGGIDLAGATLSLTNCTISRNGVEPRGTNTPSLMALYNKAHVTLSGSLFQENFEGIAVHEGRLEVEKCQFTSNGPRQLREFILACEPISVAGSGSSARIRNSTFADSAQYAAVVMAGAKIELDTVEISGTPSASLVVGDRGTGAATAEIKNCRFHNNATGLGVFAGSSATVNDTQLWDNQDGIIVVDEHSQVRGEKLDFQRDRDVGLFVHGQGSATVQNSQFKDNARDAVAGLNGKEAQRGTLALEDCQFSGSRVFSIGACRGSEVSLTNCHFEKTRKELYREEGAKVERNEATPTVSPTPATSDEETSATPDEENSPNESPSPTSSATPEPNHRPHHRATPRPHLPTAEEIRNALRGLLPGN